MNNIKNNIYNLVDKNDLLINDNKTNHSHHKKIIFENDLSPSSQSIFNLKYSFNKLIPFRNNYLHANYCPKLIDISNINTNFMNNTRNFIFKKMIPTLQIEKSLERDNNIFNKTKNKKKCNIKLDCINDIYIFNQKKLNNENEVIFKNKLGKNINAEKHLTFKKIRPLQLVKSNNCESILIDRKNNQ